VTAPEHKPGKRSTFIATAALTTPAPALADKTDDIYLAYLPALKAGGHPEPRRRDCDGPHVMRRPGQRPTAKRCGAGPYDQSEPLTDRSRARSRCLGGCLLTSIQRRSQAIGRLDVPGRDAGAHCSWRYGRLSGQLSGLHRDLEAASLSPRETRLAGRCSHYGALILASQPPELRYVSKYRVDDDQAGRRKLDKRVAPHGWPYLSPKGAASTRRGHSPPAK